jgi:hypothetical protein
VPGLCESDARRALLLLRALIDADAGSERRTVPRAVESAILKAVVIALAATNQSAHVHAFVSALSGTVPGANARASDAVVDAVARPFICPLYDTNSAAHAKLRAHKSADRNTHFLALSGALSSTIDELRPDECRPAIIKTDADADADPVAGALDGSTNTSVPDGVSIGCGRHE